MPCPSLQQLERLLNDELSSADGDALAGHVSDCVACQRHLDALTSPLTSPGPPEATLDESQSIELLSLMKRLRLDPFVELHSPKFDPTDMVVSSFVGPFTSDAPLGWLGTYQIQRAIGSGATGEVFEARDSRLGRLVAIKVLRPQLAAQALSRARFEREGRAIAAIRDAHIAQVFEIGTTADAAPYLVMEFVGGESLEARLRREGSLDPRDAAEIVRQVANGLDAAHRQGVVHRDVKLSNVLLEAVEVGTLCRAKIVDFGLARVTQSPELLTQEGILAGTPAYMSPEQFKRPQDADARSDIYSLGVLLYELLTGERPFRGVLRMVLFQVLHEEPVPLRRLNDRLPRDLETICLKAMSKEPARRYATARDFAEDLQRWLDGRPVLARPLGPLSRAVRWCRRNPKLAVLNSVVALVLLGGAIDWTRYAFRSASLRDEAAVLRVEANQAHQLAQQSQQEIEQLKLQSLRERVSLLGLLADELLERKEFSAARTILNQAVPLSDRARVAHDAGPGDFRASIVLHRNLALVERALGQDGESKRRFESLLKLISDSINDPRSRSDADFLTWANSQRLEIEAAKPSP